jgi:leucyl aminopeptidase (aminopeptidase T)
LRDIARRLVAHSARLREGDLVLLSGGDADLPLLEDLAIEARRLGADPLVSVQSDRYLRRGYDEVPTKYDSRGDELSRRMTEFLTAMIFVESNPSDTVLRGVPPSRIAARLAAMQPALALAERRNIRRVTLGNGLYPTEERARSFGMTQAALAGSSGAGSTWITTRCRPVAPTSGGTWRKAKGCASRIPTAPILPCGLPADRCW